MEATETTEPIPTRIKHFANLGDIIAILPALKKYWEVTGRKVIFSQQVNTLAAYYAGAVHPTKNSDGQHVCVNDSGFEMIKPLIESQEYIHSMERYEGQKIDFDFDVIRGTTFVNMPHGMIQSWIFYAFPDLACDLSQPWVKLPDEEMPNIKELVQNKVIINFTERYRNHITDYHFLKEYAPNLIFAGTEREHYLFCNQWQLTIPRLEVSNFLESAYALKYCKFLLSNQSFLWNLGQAMHIPRVLEVCSYAANCAPFVGKDSYGFYHQLGANYYFRLLFNKY